MKIQRVNYNTYRLLPKSDNGTNDDIWNWIKENKDFCMSSIFYGGNVQRYEPAQTVSIMDFTKLNEFRDLLAMKKLKNDIVLEEYYE